MVECVHGGEICSSMGKSIALCEQSRRMRGDEACDVTPFGHNTATTTLAGSMANVRHGIISQRKLPLFEHAIIYCN